MRKLKKTAPGGVGGRKDKTKFYKKELIPFKFNSKSISQFLFLLVLIL